MAFRRLHTYVYVDSIQWAWKLVEFYTSKALLYKLFYFFCRGLDSVHRDNNDISVSGRSEQNSDKVTIGIA